MHACAVRAGIALDSRCMHTTLVSKGGVADVWCLRQRCAPEPRVKRPRKALEPRYLLLAHALWGVGAGTYMHLVDVYLYVYVVLYMYVHISIFTTYMYMHICMKIYISIYITHTDTLSYIDI